MAHCVRAIDVERHGRAAAPGVRGGAERISRWRGDCCISDQNGV
jgi:hypothetical protein